MANEITISGALSMKKGDISVASSLGPFKIDLAGDDYIEFTQPVQTSATAISIGASGTAGWALIRNLDPTNFIALRNGAAGADLIKLEAGEFCLFRLATQTLFGIADTAICRIHCLILED